MIICFQCNNETKNLLDELMEGGEYKHYGDIIALAVSNLSLMQREIGEAGELVFGGDLQPNSGARPNASRREGQGVAAGRASTRAKGVPEIFTVVDDGGKERPSVASLPSNGFEAGRDIELYDWLFGHYNRLLPAKATCRALANLLMAEPDGVTIEGAPGRIAEEAARLGDFLAEHDKRHGLKRDIGLATAFPRSGRRAEKSRVRYAGQFVAATNGSGDLMGLPTDLKLVNYAPGTTTHICLTEPGWRFALLGNPVLDCRQHTPTQRFSVKEVSFLLKHIAECVPAEDFAYRTILSAIADGADTPSLLDGKLRLLVPSDRRARVTEAFLSSQRSGAISRMVDLGLIEREWRGIKVLYVLRDEGRGYLITRAVV